MALSNWATLAFNQDGNPTNGVFEAFNGAFAEVYKNWLYVRDAKSWHEGLRFSEPTIASVHAGEMTIAGMEIQAIRPDEGNAIFVFVHSTKYDGGADGKTVETRSMYGIGCYGYDDSKWVGVSPAMLADFHAWLLALEAEHYGIKKEVKKVLKANPLHFNQGDAFFAGVAGADIPAVAVGEKPPTPIMTTLIDNMVGKK